jgi:PAS domain S-box-containing protein
MDNYRKTKAQLVRDLDDLQQRLAAFEAAAAEQQSHKIALAASQREYDALVNSIDGIVWEFDLAVERFTFVSQQAERLLGYPIERWLSEANFWLERIHPDDRAWVTQLAVRETQARRGYEMEYRVVSADQRNVWVRSIINVMAESDHPLRLRGITVDISARKRAQQALDRHARGLMALYDTSLEVQAQPNLPSLLSTIIQRAVELVDVHSGGLFLVAPDRQTLQLAVAHHLPDAAIGQRIQMGEGLAGRVAQSGQTLMIHDYADWKGRAQRWSNFSARRTLGLPLTVDRSVIGVLVVIDAVRAGSFSDEEVRLLSLFADQAAMAIEKARLYEQAQSEVIERRRGEAALRQAYAELQSQTEELYAFAHTVAHDLKNPLSLITGYANLLEESLDHEQPELPNLVRSIILAGEKMNSIIEELMLLAGLRDVPAQMEPLGDMAHIVAEAHQRLTGLIEKRQAQLVMPDTWPVALGYGPWVEEVWVNYLSNAIKYGGDPPQIELGADLLDGGAIRFWVRDHGPGLSPEQQARLFIPFERLDQVELKGHGLGLSIVRRIVEKMGGQVGVESAVGEGCRSFFTLPKVSDSFSS